MITPDSGWLSPIANSVDSLWVAIPRNLLWVLIFAEVKVNVVLN
jgi:hypothetical protein